MWELHVYFGEPNPLQVTTKQYAQRPASLDWVPPENPGWGQRGGTYHYVWYQDGLVEILSLLDKHRSYAETLLQDLDVVVRRVTFTPSTPDDTRVPGTILTQDIPAGSFLAQGASIMLEVVR